MSASKQNHARRFSGLVKLYGEQGFKTLTQSHVVIIGVGGVGSWTVESLARSGIGQLTLIDLDHLSESNINRHLPALDSTLGVSKVQTLQSRISEINARCKVHCIEDFIKRDNIGALLGAALKGSKPALVIDCIDHAPIKAALVVWCKQHSMPLITVGGAGACINPLRIKVADLAQTENDLLLSHTRKILRQKHGYPRNLKRKFAVKAVFSDEPRIKNNGLDAQAETNDSSLNCAGYGSVVHVTASFGFVAASKAIDSLIKLK
ncbi:MAG: tRNA threonylcarbamoyladenosine dehydratase [Arenicellales bacterium]